jgi:hypothetical protein
MNTLIKKRTKRQIATTAYHEAGHTVVADALGYSVDKIELYDPPLEDGSRGRVFRYTNYDDDDEALIAVAGIVAESIYANRAKPYPLTPLNLLNRFSCDDIQELKDAFKATHDVDDSEYDLQIWGPLFTSYFSYQCCRVKVQFLAPNWSKVQRIAQALIEEGTVGGSDLLGRLADEPEAAELNGAAD